MWQGENYFPATWHVKSHMRVDAEVMLKYGTETSTKRIGVNSTVMQLASGVFRAAISPNWNTSSPLYYNHKLPEVEMMAVDGVSENSHAHALALVHTANADHNAVDVAYLRQYSIRQLLEFLMVFDAWCIVDDWPIGKVVLDNINSVILGVMHNAKGRQQLVDMLSYGHVGAMAQLVMRQHLGDMIERTWTSDDEHWGAKIDGIDRLVSVYGSATVFELLKPVLVPRTSKELLSFGAFVRDTAGRVYDGIALGQCRRWSIMFGIAKWLLHPVILAWVLSDVIARDAAVYQEVILDNLRFLTPVDVSALATFCDTLRARDPQLVHGQSLTRVAYFVHPSKMLVSFKIPTTCSGKFSSEEVGVTYTKNKSRNDVTVVVTPAYFRTSNLFIIMVGSPGHELGLQHFRVESNSSSGNNKLTLDVPEEVVGIHGLLIDARYTYDWFTAMQPEEGAPTVVMDDGVFQNGDGAPQPWANWAVPPAPGVFHVLTTTTDWYQTTSD
jgi:hypothetical protein